MMEQADSRHNAPRGVHKSQSAECGRWRISARAALFSVLLPLGLASCGEPLVPRVKSLKSIAGTDTPAVPADDSRSTPMQFRDITPDCGCQATYRNGREAKVYAILESLGGGAAICDYDRDGQPDLMFPVGGTIGPGQSLAGLPSRLYRGLGKNRWSDVSTAAGCKRSVHYSHGCTAGDCDNDGFPDFLITGYGGLCYWRNQGDGTFVEQTAVAGLLDTQWSSSAAWGDLNGDGWLDLYVAHYVNWSFENHPHCHKRGPDGRDVCPPREFEGLDDSLYFAVGDGTFREVSKAMGLQPQGKGLGVLLGDVDGDGDLDIYVANDTTENFLYLNQGGGRFREQGMMAGVATDDRGLPNGSMGIGLGDLDNDGMLDLFVTNFEEETFALYHNLGKGNFLHASRETGVTAVGSLYVGFGTVVEDLDLDGDEDLAVLNGHVVYYPPNADESQLPIVLENMGQGKFRKVTPGPAGGYFSQTHVGRGLAAGDLNDDGRVDLVTVHLNAPASLLLNETPTRGAGYSMRLVGVDSNRDAIGAQVQITSRQGHQSRHRYGGGSYLSHSDLRLRWGVPPEDQLQGVTIHWPSGQKQTIPAWPPGKTLIVRERAVPR